MPLIVPARRWTTCTNNSPVAQTRRARGHWWPLIQSSSLISSQVSSWCTQTPMTKTRRQTKAKSAPQAADVESQPSSPLPSQTSFTLDIPDDIDTEALALLLPDAELETPSKDGIIALYRLVVAQSLESEGIQREVEGLKAEVDRKDIELDQAVQDKETAVSELESSLEKVRDELKQVKEDKEEIGM